MTTQKQLNELTFEIIGAAIEVHKTMGKGLLENIYHHCLIEELKIRNINFISEKNIPVFYKEKKLAIDFKCDLLVENTIVIELKSVSEITPIHKAQLLTYMKLLNVPKGILINFNCFNIFKEGQMTFVNEIFHQLPKH
ncbi:GxxExxY protein [Flavobacterium sp.]|uniref:GxxExxY protein n=1 Tax=Flavobacterium sp. TaxID=239 RepID=UPI00263272F5|nr:GxxExxY protein [Flavobacterium sp.]